MFSSSRVRTHTRRYTTVYFYRTKYLHILAYSVIVFIVTHLSHAYTRETVTSARENPLRARARRGGTGLRAPGSARPPLSETRTSVRYTDVGDRV